jgi:copper(I)-binding protein
VEHPWCAASPKGVVTGACYVTVRNLGTTPIRIVGVDIAVCNHTELHETDVADGIMKMRPVPRGVEIPAKTSVDFHTHGYHLMLLELKSSLELGQRIEGSLRFESGGSKKIEFHVETRRL